MMNNAVKGLSFTVDGLSNRPLFLSDLNDVNFYVEDTNKEYEYEELFERLFKDKLKISCVFPLGGKDAVIKHHDTNKMRNDDGKLNIYVVDGDFDNLWSDRKTVSPNLIYLTRYNIESFLCSKEAVITYMRSFLKKTREEVEKQICFDSWKEAMRDELGDLFILFALVQRYYPDLPNVKIGSAKFLDDNGHVELQKVEAYSETVSVHIDHLQVRIESLRETLCSQFGEAENSVLSIICGKYQFDSLCRHLKACCKRNLNHGNFRSTLITNCDLSPLSFLKDHVLHLMESVSDELPYDDIELTENVCGKQTSA